MITTTRSFAPSYTTNTTSNTTPNEDSLISNIAGGAMGRDEFVKLLVAQMSNQDPLNPMDGKELATQLAQFSSVEQLLNVNSKLDEMIKLLSPSQPDNNGSNTNA